MMLINGKAYVEDSVNTLRIGNTMELHARKHERKLQIGPNEMPLVVNNIFIVQV